ncbi:uncharacterized protein FFNC_15617 [Fusarium fujikuroi]|nr:uncharacterized protein FFNC_15617 [Fusarium fujikuroi]
MTTLSRTNKQASLPCPAWVWASGSNIRTAKDRSVTLLTKVSPNKSGPPSHGTLRLTNVLHVPSTIGIIAQPILEGYNITTPGIEGNITDFSDGRSVAYFKRQMEDAKNFEIRLSSPPIGPKVGPSPFHSSMMYCIRATWPDSERERFAALQGSRQPAAGASLDIAPSEKTWLKKNFQSEFQFLHIYGLSVFREDGASDNKKSDVHLRCRMILIENDRWRGSYWCLIL